MFGPILQDRLASIGSSTSMVEVSSDYAAHFHDMFVKNHDVVYYVVYDIVYDIVGIPYHVWKAANQQDIVPGT